MCIGHVIFRTVVASRIIMENALFGFPDKTDEIKDACEMFKEHYYGGTELGFKDETVHFKDFITQLDDDAGKNACREIS